MAKLVFGIVGPIGAGKDTVADYLVGEHGFVKFSTSDEIRHELRARGVDHFTRQDIQEMATELRSDYKEQRRDILTERALARLEESETAYGIILNTRLEDGISYLREQLGEKFHLIAVEVPQRTRFERKQGSERSDDSDLQQWEAFKEKDDEELSGEHGGAQEVSKVVRMADIVVTNDGTLDDLYGKLDALVEDYT